MMFYLRISRLCRFPLKVSIQLFMGTLISAFVTMCVCGYSILLDDEIKQAISGIDSPPFLYYDIYDCPDYPKISEYCKNTEGIRGTAAVCRRYAPVPLRSIPLSRRCS